jgi:hypothetical protein
VPVVDPVLHIGVNVAVVDWTSYYNGICINHV